MGRARWLVYIILALVLQTQISLAGTPLNLGVILVYAFGLRCCFVRSSFALPVCPEMQSAFFGALVGLAEDILGGHLLGPQMLSKGLVGFLFAVLCSDVLFRWTPLLGCICLFAFTLLDGLIAAGLRALFTEFSFSVIEVARTIAIQAVVNSLFGFVVKPSENAAHG